MEESNTTMKLSNEKKSRCKWTEKAIKSLLSFTKDHKEVLKELVAKRGGSSNIKAELWSEAATLISDNENRYSHEQCEVKWKNIKRAFMVKKKNIYIYFIKKF